MTRQELLVADVVQRLERIRTENGHPVTVAAVLHGAALATIGDDTLRPYVALHVIRNAIRNVAIGVPCVERSLSLLIEICTDIDHEAQRSEIANAWLKELQPWLVQPMGREATKVKPGAIEYPLAQAGDTLALALQELEIEYTESLT